MAAITKCSISGFRGALIGAVIGDCLGAHFEGDMHPPMKNILQHFSDVKKYQQPNDDNTREVVQYTDDTAMTLAIASSLSRQPAVAVDVHQFHAADMAKGFVEEFFSDPNRGYGGNVITVFQALKEENCRKPFGPAERQFDGRGSYGNGGAMRISPAALVAIKRQPEEVDELVKNITRITHTNIHGINGALLQSAAIQTALTSARSTSPQQSSHWTDNFLNALLTRMQKHEDQSTELLPTKMPKVSETGSASRNYCQKLESIRRLLQQKDVPRLLISTELGNEVSALKSVPAAIYTFLRCMRPVDDIPAEYNDFQRTVIYAVSLGGDTDTIASMAGAIAGAYYGDDCIPAEWRRACEATDTATQFAERLYQIVYSESDDSRL